MSADIEDGAKPERKPQGVCEIIKQVETDVDEMRLDGKIDVSGRSYLVHLTSMYWGVRGLPETVSDLAWPVLLFQLGVDSKRGGVLSSLVFTPWAMKPLFAITSDVLPVFYYRKRWYMCAVAGLGALAAAATGLSSDEGLGGNTASRAFIYVFVLQIAIAMCDSLSQGQYTEICKLKGSAVISYTYASKNAAGGIAALVGPALARISAKLSYIAIVPFFGIASTVFGLNFMGDKKEDAPCKPKMDVVRRDFKIVGTGMFLGLWALMMAMLEIVGLGEWQLIIGSIGLVLVISITFWSLPKAIAVINVYIMACRVMTFDFRYQLLQWYTAGPELCQHTPHFPLVVYQAMGYVLGSIATLFGVWLFQNYVYYWNIRAAFWVTTLFTTVAALFDLSMLTGFNRTAFSIFPFISNARLSWDNAVFGKTAIPVRLDDLMGFLIGTQALKPIVTTLDEMPATIMLSKLCPPGVETTVFAMLAAMQNLGLQISGLYAAEFLSLTDFNIENKTLEEGGFELECNEGNGWAGFNGIQSCLIVGGIILPLLTIPITFILLPNRKLNDDFVDMIPAQEGEARAGTFVSNASQSQAADEHGITTQASWLAHNRGGSKVF